MRKSAVRGIARVILYLAVNLVLIPAYLALYPLGPVLRRLVRRLYCRISCAILGIQLHVRGEPFRGCPTLFVANHVSYLDIIALGSFLDAPFIAKSEVASWPFFGFLARLTGTMFIRRHWRQALIQRNALAARMRSGNDFILFGEGTSTDGIDVLPLKTSLLSVAEPWILDKPVAVQPVTLVYLRLADGSRFNKSNCDAYAWHGAGDLLPHLLTVLQLQGVELEVHFGTPALSWGVASRKVLGRELRSTLAHTLHEARLNSSARQAEMPTSVVLQCEEKIRRPTGLLSDRTCVCGLAPLREEKFN